MPTGPIPWPSCNLLDCLHSSTRTCVPTCPAWFALHNNSSSASRRVEGGGGRVPHPRRAVRTTLLAHGPFWHSHKRLPRLNYVRQAGYPRYKRHGVARSEGREGDSHQIISPQIAIEREGAPPIGSRRRLQNSSSITCTSANAAAMDGHSVLSVLSSELNMQRTRRDSKAGTGQHTRRASTPLHRHQLYMQRATPRLRVRSTPAGYVKTPVPGADLAVGFTLP